MSQYLSGTAGNVGINGVTVFGIKSWRLSQTTAEVALPNFQSPVDGNGRVWPRYLVGLSGATGTGEGQFLSGSGSPTDATISTGFYVLMTLQFNKADAWGYQFYAWITSFEPGTAVENQPATFTFNFRVDGIVPLSAAYPVTTPT